MYGSSQGTYANFFFWLNYSIHMIAIRTNTLVISLMELLVMTVAKTERSVQENISKESEENGEEPLLLAYLVGECLPPPPPPPILPSSWFYLQRSWNRWSARSSRTNSTDDS